MIARRALLGGGLALTATTSGATAQSTNLDYAVFTEFSPQAKKMLPGWNRRIFTDTAARQGSNIQCDFTTGIVSLQPGAYRLSGFSMVGYDSSKEPPEMTATRSPAAAGYCRLRRVTADPGLEQLDLRAIDNGDPTVLSIGSMSSANLTPSVFDTYCQPTEPMRLLLEHQAGSHPQDIYLRIFIANSKWHSFASISIHRLQ